MQTPLAVGMTLVVAAVCGIAQWPEPAGTRPRASGRGAHGVHDRDVPVLRQLPAEVVPSMARSLLTLLDAEQRQRAVLGEQFAAELMLTRHMPPAALAGGGGLPFARLDAGQQALAVRLLEHFAAAVGNGRADRRLLQSVASRRVPLFLSWAGSLSWAGGAARGPCYLRLHSDGFVVEWVQLADDQELAAWRDFAHDATAPWLREQVGRLVSVR